MNAPIKPNGFLPLQSGLKPINLFNTGKNIGRCPDAPLKPRNYWSSKKSLKPKKLFDTGKNIGRCPDAPFKPRNYLTLEGMTPKKLF